MCRPGAWRCGTVAHSCANSPSKAALAAARGEQDADAEPCASMRASTATAHEAKGFDRTGIITVRCRHAILLAAVVMTSGEKFAYSLAALGHLLAKGLPITRLWYDVGDGRLHAAMQAFERLRGITPMLPELHAKMHALSCQLIWAGTMAEGAGLPNSELSEQENRRLGLVRRALSVSMVHSSHIAGATEDLVRDRGAAAADGVLSQNHAQAGSGGDGHGGGPTAGHDCPERGAGKLSKGTCGRAHTAHILAACACILLTAP